MFVQVVGLEVISDGVMICQGEACHIVGYFLRSANLRGEHMSSTYCSTVESTDCLR